MLLYPPCINYHQPLIEPIPQQPPIEPLTRQQVLIAMGVTSVLLLAIARIWLHFSPEALLPIVWEPLSAIWGVGIGLGITLLSSLTYRIWEAYRRSADFYLELVIKPLVWSDLIWLGLLPGMSEELLFRGLLLPAIGLNAIGIIVSSLLFGILHLYGAQQWAYVVWATIIGGLLAVSAIATGNLLVPIVAHITTNLIAGLMWKMTARSQQ